MDDAARSLGLSPARTLARVHVPIIWGSLATAALLVFVDVMKELPATFAMRPFNFDTLAVEAYNLAKDERIAEAAVPSLVMVGIALAAVNPAVPPDCPLEPEQVVLAPDSAERVDTREIALWSAALTIRPRTWRRTVPTASQRAS